MDNPTGTLEPTHLPVKRELNQDYSISWIIAILMGIASLGGLVFPSFFYTSDKTIHSLLVNDIINLIIGLPILLGSMWLTRRGNLVGLLLWPGALIYTLYNYVAYIFGVPIGASTFIFVALVLLSAFNFFHLLYIMDREFIGNLLAGTVPAIVSGLVLLVFGIGFLFRAIGMLVEASSSRAVLASPDYGTLVADLLLSTIWIVGGATLLARKPLGYSVGLGLLFSTVTLIAGLILFLLIEPALTAADFLIGDVVTVAIFGLICVIPFALYLRGVISERS